MENIVKSFQGNMIDSSLQKREERRNLIQGRQYLEERTEGAEEVWECPDLEEWGLELEGNDEETNDNVRQRQIGDEKIGHRLEIKILIFYI